jgi:hypothetical protein
MPLGLETLSAILVAALISIVIRIIPTEPLVFP